MSTGIHAITLFLELSIMKISFENVSSIVRIIGKSVWPNAYQYSVNYFIRWTITDVAPLNWANPLLARNILLFFESYVIQEGAASTGIVAIIRFVMCLQPYNRYLFVFRFVPHILPLWSCKQGQQDEKSVNTCYHFRNNFRL